jgi:hypothetical protein
MSTQNSDNCYGDAQLPSSPEELAQRLRGLRKDRYQRDAKQRLEPKQPRAKLDRKAENPAVFVAAECLNLSVDAAIYGHGRISSRALDWLARTTNSKFSLLHLPDYDPLGLSEFQRLHARLGKRVALYLPSDLELRFARFSNAELLKKANSQAMLARLRKSELVAIRPVVALIDRYNAGLEQEALLIPSCNSED